jgi:hypothetical protein
MLKIFALAAVVAALTIMDISAPAFANPFLPIQPSCIGFGLGC